MKIKKDNKQIKWQEAQKQAHATILSQNRLGQGADSHQHLFPTCIFTVAFTPTSLCPKASNFSRALAVSRAHLKWVIKYKT